MNACLLFKGSFAVIKPERRSHTGSYSHVLGNEDAFRPERDGTAEPVFAASHFHNPSKRLPLMRE